MDHAAVPAPPDRADSGRQAYAAGDVVFQDDGDPHRLRVEAPFAKQGWQPRQPATLTQPLFPGTAIEHEGRLYEVHSAIPLGSGVTYELAEWEDRMPIRLVLRYDRASAEAELAARGAAHRLSAANRVLLLLAPLAGLLPGDLQRQLEARFGVSATLLTTSSALPLLLVAVPLQILGIAAQMAGGFGASSASLAFAARLLPLSTFLVVEAGLRLASARLAHEPMGSLPVALLTAVWRRLQTRADAQSPAEERAVAEASDLAANAQLKPAPAIDPDLLRRARATWVETFAQVWGVLDADLQGQLATVYAYQVHRNTAWSIAGVAVLAGAAGVTALSYLLRGVGEASDLAVLGVAAYFAVETVRRGRAFHEGRVEPSALARLVAPFARRLLRF